MKGAFVQAQRLDHGWVGPEHFLLALLAEPNIASEVLAGLGLTYERFRERLTTLKPDPDVPSPKARRGMTVNPAAHELMGWATGFAAASGLSTPQPEQWLVAFLYASDRGAMWLRDPFELSAKTVIDALATHGVRVPDFPPPEFEPRREGRTVYVSKEEVWPIVDVLNEFHPPESGWQWGFNVVGRPRRGRIHAEDGIDLDAVVAKARALPRKKNRR
jgi:ATP-dependent Clp protease ATP-binding subunit ClpA